MKTLIDLSSEIFDTEGLFHKTGKEGDKIELAEKRVSAGSGGTKTEKLPLNGCTYNFNRDIDKLCFKNALARFLRTGTKEDAFDVFFCYSEIYNVFGGYKQGIDRLLELLFQHEKSGASLLSKHRDHYSHSVYVFALGLAVFTHNKTFRSAFAKKYGKEDLNGKFLKYWGMASLFHDIGYPYEISFLQVREYGEKIDNDAESERLRMSYVNLDDFCALSGDEIKKCGQFMPEGEKDINALFASETVKMFGGATGDFKTDFTAAKNCIKNRITNAVKFMDHGYFSAVLFFKKLLRGKDFAADRLTVDAITAILLHNSFYKRTYKSEIMQDKYKQISINVHPLAYLLMFCDELQCWDRAPYGEISRKQELAWDIDIYIDDKKIDVKYYFETGAEKDTKKITALIDDINSDVVCVKEMAEVTASAVIKRKDKKVYDYFSDSKFVNLCKIAETINVSYMEDCETARIKEYMRENFDTLTLEYKLSNVAQAKNYIRHLENINCFFSDRQLDYPQVEEFTENELEYLAINEHIRWVNEKVEMGWKYGEDYTDREDRARKRIHKDIIPYGDLTANEKKKDYFPINNMIKHLAEYGIKVYRMNNVRKPQYILGCTGHRDLKRIAGFDEERVRGEVRSHIRKLKERYLLQLFCGFADGADLLFAEEALKCGVDVIAVLPCEWREFISEHKDGGVKFMQILGQTKEVRVKPSNINRYVDMSRYIVRQSDEMLVLWDGVKLPLSDENGAEINRGGTYDTMIAAINGSKVITEF